MEVKTDKTVTPGGQRVGAGVSLGVPVAGVVEDLRAGAEHAQDRVFKVFYPILVKAAEAQLKSMPRNSGDAEVAASSALRSFFSNMKKEELDFKNTKSIKGFLLHVLAEKVLEQRRRARAIRRNESKVKGGDIADLGAGEAPLSIEDIAADISSQEVTTITKDFFEVLHTRLSEREKQVLAKLVIGETQAEIARQIGVALRTVEATVASIRTKARKV